MFFKTLSSLAFKIIMLIFFLICTSGFSTQSTSRYLPITSETADLVSELAKLGYGSLDDIIWSPDNRFLAMSTAVGILLFDPHNLDVPLQVIPYTGKITFSPSGNLLSIARAGEIRLWDMQAFIEMGVLETGLGHIEAVLFSEDRDILTIYGQDIVENVVEQNWNINAFTLIASRNVVRIVSPDFPTYSSDRSIIAAVSLSEIHLWNTEQSIEITSLSVPGYQPPVALNYAPPVVLFSPQGTYLAYGRKDAASLILWNLNTRQTFNLSGYGQPITSLAFTPDEQWLISTSIDNTMQVWNTADGNQMALMDVPEIIEMSSISHDSQFYAALTHDRNLYLWDVELIVNGSLDNEVESRHLAGHSIVTSLSFNADATVLASSGAKNIILWDVSTGNALAELLPFDNQDDQIADIVLSEDGSMLAVAFYQPIPDSRQRPSTIQLWDVENQNVLATFQEDTCTYNFEITSGSDLIVFTNEERELLITCQEGIYRWDFAENTFQQLISWEGLWVKSVGIDLVHRQVVLGTNYDMSFWDLQTGEEKNQTLDGAGRESQRTFAFSQDNNILASIGDSLWLRAWDISSGHNIYTIEGQNWSVGFTSTGLLIYGDENMLHIADPTTGAELNALTGHTSWITHIISSTDSSLLASGTADGAIHLWGIGNR